MKCKNMIWRMPAAFCCFVSAFLVISCVNRTPTNITIGKLSEKDTNHNPAWYRITNAAMGERTGRYLTFLMKSESRYHVVLDLSDPDVDSDGVGVWVGRCEGVRVPPIPGCACEPPFVLVSRAEPGSSMKTD